MAQTVWLPEALEQTTQQELSSRRWAGSTLNPRTSSAARGLGWPLTVGPRGRETAGPGAVGTRSALGWPHLFASDDGALIEARSEPNDTALGSPKAGENPDDTLRPDDTPRPGEAAGALALAPSAAESHFADDVSRETMPAEANRLSTASGHVDEQRHDVSRETVRGEVSHPGALDSGPLEDGGGDVSRETMPAEADRVSLAFSDLDKQRVDVSRETSGREATEDPCGWPSDAEVRTSPSVGDGSLVGVPGALEKDGSLGHGGDGHLARRLALVGQQSITDTRHHLPRPPRTRVMTVANQKGGVGKTTSVVNIGAALAQAGLRVLVVDLDPQGNASTALGIAHPPGTDSVYDVLLEGRPLAEVIVDCDRVPNLRCAPSTVDLAGAEVELVTMPNRERRLNDAIAAYLETADDDYVLVDCPPSLGLLTVNALAAATEVFIPIQCEYYALEGLSQLLGSVEMIRSHLNARLTVSTILLTMYDGRTRLAAQVAQEVRDHFPDATLRTTVPRAVRVSEAPSFGETVMTYDPMSSGALAYLHVAEEIADRAFVASGEAR